MFSLPIVHAQSCCVFRYRIKRINMFVDCETGKNVFDKFVTLLPHPKDNIKVLAAMKLFSLEQTLKKNRYPAKLANKQTKH